MGVITTPSSHGPNINRHLYKYSIYIPVGDTVSLVVDHTESRLVPSEYYGGHVDRQFHVRRISFSPVPQPPCVYTSRGRPYYKYSILLHVGDVLYVNPDNGKDNPWVVKVEWRDHRLRLQNGIAEKDLEGLPCPPFFFHTIQDSMLWFE